MEIYPHSSKKIINLSRKNRNNLIFKPTLLDLNHLVNEFSYLVLSIRKNKNN